VTEAEKATYLIKRMSEMLEVSRSGYYSRRVIGWALDEYLHTDLVEAALEMAVVMRGKLAEQAILHADPLNLRSTPPHSSRASPASTTRSAQLAAQRWVGTTPSRNHFGPQ